MAKLNDGSVYKGTFICMDGTLNVVLENATLFESIEQAQSNPDNKALATMEHFADCFIRGNNICYIVPAEEKSGKA